MQNNTKLRSATQKSKPKVVLTETGFAIPDAIRQSWATAYPGIDINRETAKALAWCQNNPRRAPKKDFGRFLNSWLGRAKPSRDLEIMLDPCTNYELSAADEALIVEFEREQARKAACNG